MNAIVPAGNTALTPTSMESAIQLAEMMARGKLVPEHLQGSPGDCLMVIEQALRWGMSPFAVAQCTGIVKGKMSYEGKLVAAAIHTSGVLNGRLTYQFDGEGALRKVTAIGHLKGEAEPRSIEVTLASARTTNEHWNKSPDQMLSYHAARVWARRHAPEVMLGVYAPEEFDQAIPFNGTTLEAEPEAKPTPTSRRDAINAEVPLRPAAAAMPRGATVREPVEPPANGRRRTISDWLTAFEIAAHDAQSAEEANRVICSDEAVLMKERVTGDAKARYDAVIRKTLECWFSTPPDAEPEDELPEVEIAGEHRLAAG